MGGLFNFMKGRKRANAHRSQYISSPLQRQAVVDVFGEDQTDYVLALAKQIDEHYRFNDNDNDAFEHTSQFVSFSANTQRGGEGTGYFISYPLKSNILLTAPAGHRVSMTPEQYGLFVMFIVFQSMLDPNSGVDQSIVNFNQIERLQYLIELEFRGPLNNNDGSGYRILIMLGYTTN